MRETKIGQNRLTRKSNKMNFQESVWKTIYRKVNFNEFIRIFTETDLPKSNKMDLTEN